MRKLWVLTIILFAPTACQMQPSNKKDNFKESAYLFVKRCLHHQTGLARRLEGDRITTPYTNALAAMALIHERDFTAAEKIFQPFQRYQQWNRDHFNGLPQLWNVETALPDSTSIHWEGDAAFLALALNYYQRTRKNDEQFQSLLDGLIQWLVNRLECSNVIVAEGIAEIAAALYPFAADHKIQSILSELRQSFFPKGKFAPMIINIISVIPFEAHSFSTIALDFNTIKIMFDPKSGDMIMQLESEPVLLLQAIHTSM